MISPKQIRAARSLLGWTQHDLSKASSLGSMTIKRIEGAKDEIRGRAENLLRIEKTLEDAGIIFIPDDENGGPGVRLKKDFC